MNVAHRLECPFAIRYGKAHCKGRVNCSVLIKTMKIYLTGHGGDSFLKFQDAEELTNVDLAYAIQTMYEDN
ncbi:hypothetical protein OSTOST_20471, partial [Ostertagia ostertagi]